MRNWATKKLGELFRIKHGYAFKGKYFSDRGAFIVLTPGNFFDAGGFKHKGEKEKYYTGPIPDGYVLGKGSLIVAMTEQAEGLLGSAAFVPADNKYLHNQRLGRVVDLDEGSLDKRFLYYLFNTPIVRDQIRATANGAKVRHTSPARIYDVEVELPALPIQRHIASILSAYDKLMENNTRRIEILEEMARRLYEEWFVQFRFPGHEGAKLESLAVGDIAEVIRGRSYRSKELVTQGGFPFVNLKCVNRDGGFRRDGLKRYDGKFKPDQVVYHGDIVMAVTDMTQDRRIVARAAMVPDLGADGGIISMDLVKILPRPNISKEFLYSLLRWSDFSENVKNHANGANVLHLHPDHIRSHAIQVPPEKPRTEFSELVKPIFDLCESLEKKNANLRAQRDLLLPKLVSGEIDVSSIVAPEEREVA
ncbi:hypothetical protein GM160_08415 [Guyparkeria halophila]|uniref:Type I restriction modification DNA specificity domain-containing protein n=1 Tax=Guyparkeria halophila TaxID=47960 RepID=A0A6I6CWY8_9GAMM|nr:restriction endonuclease subunit S [Guyparkeria halophila]QGT78916.1 hypothetical protein GM160_08415 [Guyparkeria halophila]